MISSIKTRSSPNCSPTPWSRFWERKGDFEPIIVPKYDCNTNELEEKILGLYARGASTRDIQDTLGELRGIDVSTSAVSKITDKVWELVEAWQDRHRRPSFTGLFVSAGGKEVLFLDATSRSHGTQCNNG